MVLGSNKNIKISAESFLYKIYNIFVCPLMGKIIV